jgi:hypothetical protein
LQFDKASALVLAPVSVQVLEAPREDFPAFLDLDLVIPLVVSLVFPQVF